MILNSPYISGSLIVTSNGTISGSLTVLGGITGAITGSATSASYAISASEASTLQGLGSASFAPASTFNTVSQSYAASSASLSTRVTTNETNISTLTSASASFAIVSSSYAAASGSLSTRVTNVETTASVLTSASSSFATMSGSLSTRVTNLEATSSTVSQSFASTSGSISGRVTLIEGQYATTGSNNFTGPQFVNQASNAISFTSTASLYTDGGLRVSKDSFVSGTAYFNNVVVYGTSSIQYITSSQVNFGTNIITVNTDTPAVRFGGLAVFDSGSTQLTGSILWDSEKNHWIYSNPSGSTYNSAMLMNGPRNTGSLGTEQGTTACALMIGQGGDHITSSAIFSYGNATCFYGASFISSSGAACFASTICSPTLVINNQTNISPDNNGTGQLMIQGNGYQGYTALDATAMYVGHNSQVRNLTFQTNETNRLTINGDGIACFACQVCAPNINLSNGLSINACSTVTVADWYNTNTDDGNGLYIKAGGVNSGKYIMALENAAGCSRMMVLANGNVGIGTISPEGKLTIQGTSAQPPTSGTTANSLLQLVGSLNNQLNIGSNTVNGDYGSYIQASDNNLAVPYPLNLQPNGGNVLLACSTDNNKGAKLQITQNASNTNAIDFKNTDVTYGRIGTFANGLYLTQNYYYAGGQNNDCSNFGQASINIAAGTTNLSTISFALSDAGATSPSAKMIMYSSGVTCFASTVCAPLVTVNAAVRLYGSAGGIGCVYIVTATGANEQPAIILEKAGGYGNSEIRTYYNNVPDYGIAFRAGSITGMYLNSNGTLAVPSPATGATPLNTSQNQSANGYIAVTGDQRIGAGSSVMFEYVGSVPAAGNACVLVIPTLSQGTLHTRATFEIHGVSAEYNLNGAIGAFGGVVAIEYLNNVNVVQGFNFYGTLCGVSSSDNCIRLSFNRSYNSGLSDYEGITLRIKLLTTVAWSNYFNCMTMQ